MINNLSNDFLMVVEQAAIAAAYSIGNGDRHHSDFLAVESMRANMSNLPIDGTIVIGEGERDEAPMLYIGETIGKGIGYEKVDIAVDPLEGTNLCANGTNNAITVLAVSEKGGLLHAPDLYMQKLCVGPSAKGKVDLNDTIQINIRNIAKALDIAISEVSIVVLNRSRHKKLIGEIRSAGARVLLIEDGDLSAAVSTAILNTGIHAVMGIGGAPEGVLAAAALKCLGGEMQCRLVTDSNTSSKEQSEAMGVDFQKIYTIDDLVPGKKIVFAACGVTPGNLLDGVKIFKDYKQTTSIVLTSRPNCARLIKTTHINNKNENIAIRL